MKTFSWLSLCLLLLPIAVYAQEENPRYKEAMAKMKAERVSFLTEKLELTVEEAEKFWPVYNEYLVKREELMWGKRQRMPHGFDPKELSQEETDQMINDILDQEIRLAQLKKDYFIRLKSVLPSHKVLILHRMEQEFMNHMLNQIRDNRTPGKPRGGYREGSKDQER